MDRGSDLLHLTEAASWSLPCCVLQATWCLSLQSPGSAYPWPQSAKTTDTRTRHLAFFSGEEYRQSGCTANPSMEEPQLKPMFHFRASLSPAGCYSSSYHLNKHRFLLTMKDFEHVLSVFLHFLLKLFIFNLKKI